MQYGRVLDCLMREIVFADPARVHVYMLNADVSNGFYQINLRPADAPKLGVIFPVDDGEKPLVANPMTLTMGWKNSSPLLCTSTKTVNDLSNQSLCAHAPSHMHKLDNRAAAVVSPAAPTLDLTLVPLLWDTLLLCTNAQILAYVDVFVD